MATIAIFASSLFVASALVFTKAMELKYQKKNIILGFISRLDHKFEALISNLKFRGLQLVQTVRYIIFVQAKAIFKELIAKVEQKMIEEYKKRHDAIMGKRQINNHGSASFYLKKISEDKVNGEKGKIEDSL